MSMKKRTSNVFRFLAAVLSIFLLSTADCEAAEKASNVIPRVEEALSF